ncbi:terpene synthase [Amycolatopsis acidicola]|uniref:Terpene synthase n=1 Tax=Amycolatopsis acidicola TaxID=2596893 RepID=A0A5N0VB97_9PSEU|nr:family 2 encapsulin nanocompartment cargo protein terpene cyclase [Amycolatopsis acidicola]KAA9163636.1 terpene synthase [Amycolatopsis acidicola]
MTDPDRAVALLAGPTGLGTSAARLSAKLGRVEAEAPATAPLPDPAYAERPWGDGSFPPLYCPVTERINEPLAEEVDRRLVAWAVECGFDEEEAAKLGKTGFGRLVMLAHPDCEDPDRLLISAKLNAAWWAADDLYSDDTALGAVPEKLSSRLMLAMAAMDPVPPAGEFSVELDEKLEGDKVLVALRSGVDHLRRYGTPAQVQRVNFATFTMFVSWNAYAAWQHNEESPPAWEYLAARQHDSFYTSMTLIDVLGGYELTANLFFEPKVRRAAILAGTTAVLVNDLHSVAKDLADENPPANMVLQVAGDRGCSIEEATEITVALHNDLVRDFQSTHESLLAVASPELQRFLRGLRAWMGGGLEWHSTSPRYKTEAAGVSEG